MSIFPYRGYEIEPGHQYHDDIRKYVPYALIRRAGCPDQTPIPATVGNLFGQQDEAERVSLLQAQAIIDGHLDRRDGALLDLG